MVVPERHLLPEAMLYNAKVINRLGKIEEGTTTSDYDSEEVKRQISINSAIAPCPWKNHRINVIDTPGILTLLVKLKEV